MTPPQTLVLPEAGDWRVRVVPNLYPALERQEVVVHSRRHIRSLAEQRTTSSSSSRRRGNGARRTSPATSSRSINEGREAGASLAALALAARLAAGAAAASSRGREESVVLERDGVVASCPWASRVPYETVIAPAEPERRRADEPAAGTCAPDPGRASCGGYSELEGQVPLNAWLERGEDDWRLVLFPRLNILAGLELGAGIFVNTLPPEEAAARLREA